MSRRSSDSKRYSAKPTPPTCTPKYFIRKHMSTMGFEEDDIALSVNELVAEAADEGERLRESARSQLCRSNAKTFRWADCNSEGEQRACFFL